MKKYLLIIILVLIATTANAVETVGPGQTHPTIQAGVNAASPGETVLVYDATYQEEVSISTQGVIVKSNTEWGAILDGNNKTLEAAFTVTASDVEIIGFKIQDYKSVLQGTTTQGIVNFDSGSSRSEVKYCYFTDNEVGMGNSGVVRTRTAYIVVRGNVFDSNTFVGGDTGVVESLYGVGVVVELNKFTNNATAYYEIYAHGSSDSTQQDYVVRYNYFSSNPVRLRKGIRYDVQHNIFVDYLQFHDDGETNNYTGGANDSVNDYLNEDSSATRNTFLNTSSPSQAITDRMQDNNTYTYNVIMDVSNGIWEAWPGADGITIDYNHYDNVTTQHTFETGDLTHSPIGTTTGDVSYNSTTGYQDRLAASPAQGADLKITAGVWPFTTHGDVALQSDYPYGGADTSPPSLSGGSPSGTQPSHVTTREVSLTAIDSSGVSGCRWDTADDAYADMPSGNALSTSCGSGTHCFDVTTTASTAYTRYVACTDGTTANTAENNLAISWTEGAASGDTDAPVLTDIGFSPDPETCPGGTNQQFDIVVTPIDTSQVYCGAMLTANEGSFDKDTPATYIAMECTGGATLCDGGTVFVYQPNLACDGVARNYSIVCWDTAGYESALDGTPEVVITPPSEPTQTETTVTDVDPYDGQLVVPLSQVITFTLGNVDGGITTGSIGVDLNGTAYDCLDAELTCTEVVSGEEYDVSLDVTPLAESTYYTVTITAYNLTTAHVFNFETWEPSSAGLSSLVTLVNAVFYPGGINPPDTIDPEIESGSIGTDGETVTVTFTESVDVTLSDDNDFNIDCLSAGSINLTGITGSAETYTLTAASTVNEGDTCDLDYVGAANEIVDLAGRSLGGTITDIAIANYSELPASATCDVPSTKTTGTYVAYKIANGTYNTVGQSFEAGCSISNQPVTIEWTVSAVGGAGCTDTEFYITDTRFDFMNDYICADTSGNTFNSTGEKTQQITGCTLSEGSTYYIGIACPSANGSTDFIRAYLSESSNTYADGTFWYGLYNTGDLSAQRTQSDLNFRVRIGQ